MKKIFSLLFTLSVLFFCSNIIHADFPAGVLDTVELEADFSGQGIVEFDFRLYDVSTDQELSKPTLNWNARKISINEQNPQWVWSRSYAVIKATITSGNANYYMYQKNTESSVYKSTWARTVAVYPPGSDLVHRASATFSHSGLVNKATGGGEYGGFVALSFLVTSNKLDSSAFQKSYNPEIMEPTKVTRYVTDEQDYVAYYSAGEETGRDSNFKKEYSLIACFGGPVFGVYDEEGHIAPWRPDLTDNTAYIYFGGNFMNISHDSIFGTDKLVIEKVVE